MYPDLFGIDGFSMVVMILLGVAVASIIFLLYIRGLNVEKKSYLDLIIVIISTALMGIIFAIIFENIYEAIKHAIYHQAQAFTWGMTFYGGLFGGVITFILMYQYYYLRHNSPIFKEILKIAPGCICIGHGFGRIGCFLSGCCYGIETHSSWDIYFPTHQHAYLPTQLIEMTFLFILGGVLLFLAFKNITNYTMNIYLLCYGIFRFIIEFFRGDERGQLAGLSPSQYWCILLVILSVILYFVFKRYIFIKDVDYENEVH